MSSLPSFAPIASTTKREHIVEAIRSSILAGQIEPGTQLVEMKLASQFGVSRSSIREAIRELIEEGLLINKPYAGTFVTSIDGKMMEELFQVRCVLEKEAFRLLWPQRDEKFKSELLARHQLLMQVIDGGNLLEEIKAEMHLHSYIYEASGNTLLANIWQQLVQQIQLCMTIYLTRSDMHASYKNAHDAYISKALGDSLDAMCEEIDRHLEQGLNTVRVAIEKRN